MVGEKKLVGRKILSVVKLVGEKWWVVGRTVPFGLIPTRTILFIIHIIHKLKKKTSKQLSDRIENGVRILLT